MKLKKTAAFIMAAAVCTSLCSCEMPETSPEVESRLYDLYSRNDEIVSYTKVKGKYKDFAESCFDNIEVFGANLTVPMNVSDLPEGFSLRETSQQINYTSGVNITSTRMYYEGARACDVHIIYPEGKTPEDGQIVSLEFDGMFGFLDDDFKMGGESGYFNIDKAAALLGECESNTIIIYDLGGNKNITFYLDPTDSEKDGIYAYWVTLSCIDYMY